MNLVTTIATLSARRVLSLAIVAYFTAWAGAVVFVSHMFGIYAAIALSLIFVFPFAIALRMRSRWQALRRHEFAFLITFLILVLSAAGGLVWNWYDTGMDQRHALDVEFIEFGRLLREEPTFRSVELFVSEKHNFWMRGTVASSADLTRLRSLAAQYHIRWNEELRVAANQKGAETSGNVGRR